MVTSDLSECPLTQRSEVTYQQVKTTGEPHARVESPRNATIAAAMVLYKLPAHLVFEKSLKGFADAADFITD
ncbi:hypothetical protein ROHU_020169 [Labeo rohita]|uniref:Uncharacterized protein n=1 Tax=Labeo rohita TaxID=84645 RepID=A0A498N2W5_LABRO|nr:hypothetical protein ROHU_020169 [Labeo rohita]